MNKNKDKGTFIRLTEQELERMHILKKKHAINISALIRNTINKIYEDLEKV
jgi:predicted DNA-binding protein